jgi:hypothetical protein
MAKTEWCGSGSPTYARLIALISAIFSPATDGPARLL